MYLEVKNLVKHYNSAYPIIRDLTFSVKKGELISFLGESGSGKTTFLKCLAGLEKINGGVIHLDGETLTHMDLKGKLVEADEKANSISSSKASSMQPTIS